MLDVYLVLAIICMVKLGYNTTTGKVLLESGKAAGGCNANPPFNCTIGCNSGTTPSSMQMVFPKEFDNDNCGDCADVGGTYVGSNSAGDPCLWEATDALTCAGVYVFTRLIPGGPGLLYTELLLGLRCSGVEPPPLGHGYGLRYTSSITTPLDCSTISETAVFSTAIGKISCPAGGPTVDQCDWDLTGANGSVSAV